EELRVRPRRAPGRDEVWPVGASPRIPIGAHCFEDSLCLGVHCRLASGLDQLCAQRLLACMAFVEFALQARRVGSEGIAIAHQIAQAGQTQQKAIEARHQFPAGSFWIWSTTTISSCPLRDSSRRPRDWMAAWRVGASVASPAAVAAFRSELHQISKSYV